MKTLSVIASLLFINICSAQPPENQYLNNSVINNSVITPVQNEEQELEEQIIQVKDNSNKSERKKLETGKYKSAKGYSSQSIQSSRIIENEYRKSKTQVSSRMTKPESQELMERELDKLAGDSEASFEYHLYNYTLGNYDLKREKSLNQAEGLKPNDQRVLVQKVANECVKGDTISTKFYLQKLMGTKSLVMETLDYAEDVLISSKGNDILITHGTNDTYGILYHQVNSPEYGSHEILVVSLDFLRSPYYRELLYKKGIKVPSSKAINTDYFKEFCALNSDKKIAVSLTLPIDYLRRIAPFSTPYGLVLITGNQKALCLTDLEKLWNNQLNKRNLTVHKSKLAQNYARNYKPSKVLIERFHEQQKSSPYLSSPKKLKPHKIKEGVSDKH